MIQTLSIDIPYLDFLNRFLEHSYIPDIHTIECKGVSFDV